MSKHSVTIRGLRVVTTCWSWAWSNRTSPSKWVGMGSPLAACSVYGDFTWSVHTVNNLCMFNCQCHFYLCNRGPYVRLAFVPNMLSSWNKDIIIITFSIFKIDGSKWSLSGWEYQWTWLPIIITTSSSFCFSPRRLSQTAGGAWRFNKPRMSSFSRIIVITQL